MKETKFIAWPDTHLPFHNERAVDTALSIVSWYKPDTVVILGDFLDCSPVSHWLKDKKLSKEGMRLQDDYDLGNRYLDEIIEASGCSHLVYIEGNHEDWINQALERNPEFKGMIELEKGLKFRERRSTGLKITHKKYNELHNIGKLWFTHGTYTNEFHAKKHVEKYRRSIVYGHLHDVQSYTSISPVDVEDKHMGLSLGCLADKNPEFMRNRPNNWAHCVGVGMVRSDLTFNIDPVIISKGVASYAGKTFRS